MRSITAEAINAFNNHLPFKKGNTEVVVSWNVTTLKLHGNSIAFKYYDVKQTLLITNCGWQTNTTKERLNAIDGVSIYQRLGKWFLNGKEWDGKIVSIEEWDKGLISLLKWRN